MLLVKIFARCFSTLQANKHQQRLSAIYEYSLNLEKLDKKVMIAQLQTPYPFTHKISNDQTEKASLPPQEKLLKKFGEEDYHTNATIKIQNIDSVREMLKKHFIDHGHTYSQEDLILLLFLNERDNFRLGKYESFIYTYLLKAKWNIPVIELLLFLKKKINVYKYQLAVDMLQDQIFTHLQKQTQGQNIAQYLNDIFYSQQRWSLYSEKYFEKSLDAFLCKKFELFNAQDLIKIMKMVIGFDLYLQTFKNLVQNKVTKYFVKQKFIDSSLLITLVYQILISAQTQNDEQMKLIFQNNMQKLKVPDIDIAVSVQIMQIIILLDLVYWETDLTIDLINSYIKKVLNMKKSVEAISSQILLIDYIFLYYSDIYSKLNKQLIERLTSLLSTLNIKFSEKNTRIHNEICAILTDKLQIQVQQNAIINKKTNNGQTSNYETDIYLVKYKTYIEIQGPQHYISGTTKQKARDRLVFDVKKAIITDSGQQIKILPYYEWQNLSFEEDKVAYLQKLLEN